MPIESTTQSLCDLALRFGEDGDEGGGMVSESADDSAILGFGLDMSVISCAPLLADYESRPSRFRCLQLVAAG